MLPRPAVAALLAVAPAVFAAPAPQNSFGPDSQVAAEPQTTAGPDYPLAVYENGYTSATFHGPYTGTPTTTGAADGPTTLAASIPALPPNPTETYYNSKGYPINPLPAPYMPAGGLGTNGAEPRYMVNSDFDFESIALGLYQEVSPLEIYRVSGCLHTLVDRARPFPRRPRPLFGRRIQGCWPQRRVHVLDRVHG